MGDAELSYEAILSSGFGVDSAVSEDETRGMATLDSRVSGISQASIEIEPRLGSGGYV